jgi:hypothetical protein
MYGYTYFFQFYSVLVFFKKKCFLKKESGETGPAAVEYSAAASNSKWQQSNVKDEMEVDGYTFQQYSMAKKTASLHSINNIHKYQ